MLACLLMTSLDSSWLPLACQQEMGLVWCSLVPSPSRGGGGGLGARLGFPGIWGLVLFAHLVSVRYSLHVSSDSMYNNIAYVYWYHPAGSKLTKILRSTIVLKINVHSSVNYTRDYWGEPEQATIVVSVSQSS